MSLKPARDWRAVLRAELVRRTPEWVSVGELFAEVALDIPLHTAMRYHVRHRKEERLQAMPARWAVFIHTLTAMGYVEYRGRPGGPRTAIPPAAEVRAVLRACAHCGALFLGARQSTLYDTSTCAVRARVVRSAATRAERFTHTCEGCGTTFTRRPSAKQRFCTRSCSMRAVHAAKAAAVRAAHTYTCSQCGGTFERRGHPNRAQRGRVFCGRACASAGYERKAAPPARRWRRRRPVPPPALQDTG
jgi:hypothetical protein